MHDERIPERNHTIREGHPLRFVIASEIWLDLTRSDLLGHFSTEPMNLSVPLFPNIPATCAWKDQDFRNITGETDYLGFSWNKAYLLPNNMNSQCARMDAFK